ncbi:MULTISPECIES: hypothetical protein [Peptostreptococcales]|uniref:hypothetical protein n=1 Tax=Peptostreptococcales TaxID=3082720 RepID=UPI000E4FD969|nr:MULTISPECIES: hypothetical protein [Peptostreptococcaceae]QQQ86622.1 hypothetical protein JHD53_00445 [Peptacetobacter hiranonis]RHQ94858.1 hypothetical protein DWX74_10975 [Peptoclostridium sp. AF21-18]
MYVVFGDEVLDSNEVIALFNNESDFFVETDLTKSTKREDIIALKLKINIEDIYSDSKFDQYNEEIFEEYLDNAEEIITDFVEINFDYKKRFVTSAYKWEELDNSIYLIAAFSDISLPLLKLNDVLNRLLKQND